MAVQQQEPKNEVEILSRLADAAVVTGKILRHPLRFERFRASHGLRDSGFYIVGAVLFYVVVIFLLSRLTRTEDLSFDTNIGGHLSEYSQFNGRHIDEGVILVLLAVGAFLLGRITHFVLSWFSAKTIEPWMATAASLYAFGFLLIIATVAGLLTAGVAQLVVWDPTPQKVLALTLNIALALFMIYSIIVTMAALFEWPRRLYEIRAIYFYPALAVVLSLLSIASQRLSSS